MAKVLDEEEVIDLAEFIHAESINLDELPFNNYNRVGFQLWDMVQNTMGIFLDAVDKNSELWQIMTAYKENVFNFAAAKTYQMVKDARNVLFNAAGVKEALEPFKKKFKLIERLHNDNYLNAEIHLSRRQSEASKLWLDIKADADVFPLLQYETVGDEKVRGEHAAIDNIVRPIGDAFWNTHYPPNGWGCRCTVIQLPEGEKEITPVKIANKIQAKDVEKINPLFNFNSGKEKKIFRGSHPYFMLGKNEQFRKENNFGLSIPEINNIDNAKTLES